MRRHGGLSLIYCVVLAACGGGGSSPATSPLPPLPSVDTPAYELIPGGDLVIVLATNAHDTLYGSVTGGLSARLIGAGFSLLSINLPCHEPGERTLTCWRNRLEAGDADLFLRFCAGLASVLDVLNVIEARIVGQSRGGYVAITCAAYDSRFKSVALLAPVTDLSRLSEFDGYAVNQSLHGTRQFVPYLRDRPVLVRIGENDGRVGTDAVIAFAAAVGAELQLLDVDGHVIPEDGSTVEWLLAH